MNALMADSRFLERYVQGTLAEVRDELMRLGFAFAGVISPKRPEFLAETDSLLCFCVALKHRFVLHRMTYHRANDQMMKWADRVEIEATCPFVVMHQRHHIKTIASIG